MYLWKKKNLEYCEGMSFTIYSSFLLKIFKEMYEHFFKSTNVFKKVVRECEGIRMTLIIEICNSKNGWNYKRKL